MPTSSPHSVSAPLTRRGGHPASPRRRRGIALVEYALAMPLLLLMLAGVLDYALALRTATSVSTAARAGAAYGSSDPSHTTDTAGIQSAAVNAAPDVQSMTVTSSRSCQCSGGSTVSCTGSCTGGKMLTYVQVTVTATSWDIFNYSGLGFTGSTSAQASMRAQ